MNSLNIVDEDELKRRYLIWKIRNYIVPPLNPGTTLEEHLETFTMPETEFVYHKSSFDENGDLITLLRGNYHLKDWQTRNRKRPADFEFYYVLKTLADSPEVEPFPMGYIIIKE